MKVKMIVCFADNIKVIKRYFLQQDLEMWFPMDEKVDFMFWPALLIPRCSLHLTIRCLLVLPL